MKLYLMITYNASKIWGILKLKNSYNLTNFSLLNIREFWNLGIDQILVSLNWKNNGINGLKSWILKLNW